MNVGFRWRGVNIATPKTLTERERLGENLGAVGDAIMGVKRSWAEKDEREYNRARNAAQDARQARLDSNNRARNAAQDARQARLDSMYSEDRQRRIDEEERQKRLFGDTAGLIRGKADERARLVQQREQIEAQIEALKQRIGM